MVVKEKIMALGGGASLDNNNLLAIEPYTLLSQKVHNQAAGVVQWQNDSMLEAPGWILSCKISGRKREGREEGGREGDLRTSPHVFPFPVHPATALPWAPQHLYLHPSNSPQELVPIFLWHRFQCDYVSEPRYSRRGPWAGNPDSTWELVRNADVYSFLSESPL